MKHLVFALLLLAATPAVADERLTGMAEEVLASEWADPTRIDDYLFNSLAFDHEAVETSFLLDVTPLALVQSTFGGTSHTEEIFDGLPVTWLCYDTGDARTTFAALRVQSEGNETIEPGPVLGIVIEEMRAPASDACTANAAAASPLPGNDIPGLGATLADLEARFGTAPADAGGHIAYIAEYEQGDEESWIERKTIYYRLEAGIVTGVAYRLTTER